MDGTAAGVSRHSSTDRSRIMRSDIAPGGTFPDYELPDHTKTARRLSELQGDDLLILTLARGNYCPKEHQQHLVTRRFHNESHAPARPRHLQVGSSR
jgi:hypothetical protein